MTTVVIIKDMITHLFLKKTIMKNTQLTFLKFKHKFEIIAVQNTDINNDQN